MPEAATKSSAGKQPQGKSRGPTQAQPRGQGPASSYRDVMALQRSAGNNAVASLMEPPLDHAALPPVVADAIQAPGHPLDPETREFMEVRFGRDFGHVRLHTDAQAADSALSVNANAYTVGSHIMFGQGFYAPETSSARFLLAHELAHVVQQTSARTAPSVTLSTRGDPFEQQADTVSALAGQDSRSLLGQALNTSAGTPPLLQRQEAGSSVEDEGEVGGDDTNVAEVRDNTIDEMRSTLIDALYGSPENSETDLLIKEGLVLSGDFDEGGPRTKLAAARALLDAYHVLRERAKVEVDPSGVLMHRESFGTAQVPWTPSRPHRVEDILPFSPANIEVWAATLLTAPRPPAPRRGGPKTRQPFARAGQTEEQKASRPAERLAPPSMVAGTELQPQAEDVTASRAGGPDITAGLATLKAVTLGKAIDSMTARMNEIASGSASQPVPSGAQEKSSVSLYSAAELILYVANRIYVLDRSGHIVGEEFHFDLSSVSLDRGTYFMGRFFFTNQGRESGFTANLILRIDGPKVEVVGGDIYVARVLTGLIPLLDVLRPTLQHNAGIGVIISPQFARKRLTLADFSIKKVGRALAKVPDHLEWAIRGQIGAMVEHPVETLANLAFSEGLAELAKVIPELGAAVEAYQALRTVEWLGNTVNIAAYAISEDEIDIASQSMARRLASWIVGKLIEAGKAVAKKGVQLAVRAASGPGPKPPSETAQQGQPGQKGTTPTSEEAKATSAAGTKAAAESAGEGKTSETTQAPASEEGTASAPKTTSGRTEGTQEAAPAGAQTPSAKQSTEPTISGTARPQVPGRVQSRINVRKGDAAKVGSGMEYAWRMHGGGGASSKSQFIIPRSQVEQILQMPDVVKAPPRVSGTSGNFIREVDLGPPPIGKLPSSKGGTPTTVITVITDRAGNLVNTFPGALARRATLQVRPGGGAASGGTGAGGTP